MGVSSQTLENFGIAISIALALISPMRVVYVSSNRWCLSFIHCRNPAGAPYTSTTYNGAPNGHYVASVASAEPSSYTYDSLAREPAKVQRPRKGVRCLIVVIE